MTSIPNRRQLATTPKEVRDRGASLLQRLREAGIWQYNRWFVSKDDTLEGDGSRQYRITLVLNGRGGLGDAQVLLNCEEIADRYLGRRQAA